MRVFTVMLRYGRDPILTRRVADKMATWPGCPLVGILEFAEDTADVFGEDVLVEIYDQNSSWRRSVLFHPGG